MAEDPRALMRQQASQRALATDESSRLQQALERVGIVLLPGSAAFKELMATLKTYSDETGQTFQSVLADRRQMNDIFRGKPGLPTEGRAVRERDVLSDELAKAREKVTRAIKYSTAEQSPRLARYADEVRQSEPAAGSDPGRRTGLKGGATRVYGPTEREAMAAFQKNVDPEFLDRLSFVHWTDHPRGMMAGVRGIPVTGDALSASIYLRGDPGGVGFSGNRWDQGDMGFLLDGDVTWMGNYDAMSARGEISGRHTTSLDPILDEDTYLTQQARSSLNPDMKEIYDRLGEAEASGMRGTRHEIFGMSDEVAWEPEVGNINEALIEKPRVRGIVVDPKGHRLRQVQGVVTPARRLRPGHVARSLGQAIIAAEEMGVPLYGPDGVVLYTPPNMSREEVARVSRNFPTTENIQGITPEEFASGGRWAAHPEHGGVFRVDVRDQAVKRLTDEIRLHEVPGYEAAHDKKETLHTRSEGPRTTPLTSPEELEDAVQHFRARPDFRVETDIVDANYNEVLPEKLKYEELEPRLSASHSPGPVSSTRLDEFQRVRDQIQEAEERLAQAPPGSPESREVASKLAKAKAALAKLGHLAGVAGTAYEGGRLLGEVARHGPLEGTQRYGGTLAKEFGGMAQIPAALAETYVPGYGERGVHPGAELLAGAGRALQRGGRALRGEREEIGGVGLDPNIQGLDDMDLGIPEYTPPEMTPEQKEQLRRAQEQPLPEYLQPLRPNLPLGRPPDLREQTRNAAQRALMSSRERDEENL